jgi:hypothetical protein
MLKAIARMFEFKEASISRGKLRLILFSMVLSLPTWPIVMADYYDLLPDNGIGTFATAAMFAGALSMLFFVGTRFVNRFYFPDKYLDEWEVRIKHKSMTFAFMVIVWGSAPVAVIIAMAKKNYVLSLSGEGVAIWLVGLLLVLLYVQTFHALWQVRPIDEDEMDGRLVKT